MSKKNREASRRVKEMQAAQRAKEKRRQSLIVGAVVVAIIAVVVGIGIAVQSSRDSTNTASSTTPPGVTDTYGVERGQADAPVTLTVYEDFQCPICKQYEGWLGDTITKEVDAGTLKVVYRPLAFLDRMSSTEYSSRALATAGCVLADGGSDAFVKFHQLLFENQPAEGSAGLTDAELASMAEKAGAEKSTVEACQSDDTYAGWAERATDQGSKDGVTGTPTMKLNGADLPITSATDQAAAVKMLEDAIAAAG